MLYNLQAIVTLLLFVTSSIQAQQIQFDQASYFVGFDEEQSNGTTVTEIRASYLNSFGLPRTDGTFSLPTTGDAQLFTIETTSDTTISTGIIRSRAVFDRDAVNARTQFSFMATYTTPDDTSASASINVFIQDVNDNRPMFSSKINLVSLLEDTVAGTTFVTITATDPDQVQSETNIIDISPDVQDEVEVFTITNGRILYNITSGNSLGHFVIGRQSGSLSVSEMVVLDIDAVDFYNLTVMATDGGGLSDVTIVTIEVVDANDNAPQILGPLGVNLTIPEDTQPGYVIVDHINATDLDRGVNAEIRFSIISGDMTDSFSIDAMSGHIEVSAPLDREVGSTVQLTVQARDLGIPQPMQSTVQVVVKLLDINDYTPQFTQTSYTVSVSENLRPPALVTTLEAIDLDEGPNGTVSYTILTGGDGRFTIDNSTGDIHAVVSLDHEEVNFYELLVRAVDAPLNDSYQLSAEVNVTILVGDMNDNAPVFLSPAYNTSILDDQKRRTEILRVIATDADGGSNGQIRYLISTPDPTDSDAFLVNETNGVIYRERMIIFENQSVYSFTVQARDGGSFPLADATTVTIYVHNVNKNPPVFNQSEYNVTVMETTNVGTVVLNVSAYDPDVGLIGEIHYRIVSDFDTAGSFVVDQFSGEISVSSRLNFDVKAYVFFVVEAYDGGFPDPFTARVNVTVYLTEENDEAPSITFPDGFSPTVPENDSPGFEVVFLSQYTFDPDIGVGGEFTFRLVEIFDEFSQNDSFSFNETTGLITSLRTFDRELQPGGIIIAIETIDFGIPQQSKITNITIVIGDRNDNPPYFEYNATAEVYEFMPPGTQVPLNYTALDDDIGINARLEYGIFDGVGAERFTIDSVSGIISTTEVLNKTEQLFYNLTIIAMDQGVPQMFGFGFVVFEVIDANDQIPIFSESVYNVSLPENLPNGILVTQVNASDSDVGTNANLEYFISENSTSFELFAINTTSGEIFSNVEFDRENVSVIYVEVVAIDNGLVPLTGSATVRVYIQDVNDNTPLFNRTLYSANVTENAPNETVIATVLALDADAESPNNQITYSLFGERSDIFIVDSSTGNVLVAGEVDWELGEQFTVTVIATDGGSPSRTDTAELTIRIEDINDVAPLFVPGSLNLSIFENTLPGNTSVVGYVQAVDADSPGNNSLVTYSILMDFTSGRFELDSETGLVTFVQHSLDREVRDLYDILIRASDHGNPRLHTDATLFISVTDSNEFSPVFDSAVYSGQVAERAVVGTSILTVLATDIDIDLNGELRYSILDSTFESLFQVNATTGVISTASEVFDFESETDYRFQVGVTDLGSPVQFNDTTLVVITILDSNDNSPIFQQDIYSATIRENLASGTTVLQVLATDFDSTTNEEIEYTLPPRVSDYFGVDPLTGVLYTRQFIDREVTPEFSFLVTANNSKAADPLYSTVNIFINVSDLNDMHPTFEPVINIYVLENTTIGSTVFTLNPEDGDQGRNGTITFTVTQENAFFGFDDTSGDISLIKELDFEIQEFYILTVMATDSGSPSLSNYTNVLIHVLDVNDNFPQFFANISTTISFAADVGSFVANCEAYDIDSSTNAELVFTILAGNELGLFELASESEGILITAASLSSLTESDTVVLVLGVSNPGLNGYNASVSIFIDEGQVTSPRFASQNFTASLPENTIVGDTVFDFTGLSNVDIFSLSPEFASRFNIDTASGVITLRSPLDYESQRLYQLTVEGTRSGQTTTAYTVLTIEVTDVNEHPPQFIASSFFIALSETAPILEPFFVAIATDEDGALPATVITYSISTLDSTVQSHFGINPQTGGLFLRTNLDYEFGIREFNFTISAANDLSSFSEANVSIAVLNGNTFSPVFTQTRFVLTFDENIDAGLNFLNVSATDQDEGSHGDITYGLHGNHDYFDFRIDTFTGQIFINNPLDYERHSFYTLEVIAGDGGNPGRTGTAIVQVSIGDLNDNSPVWESAQYAVIVSENVTVGTELINVMATDADQVQRDENGNVDVDNGLVAYSIVDGDPIGHFHITVDTGVVSVATPLNREQIQVYNLTLRATDGGGRLAEAFLHITLTDVNDQVPAFTESPYIVGLPENSSYSVFVLTVVAIDTDLRESSELTYHFNGSSSDVFVDGTGTFYLNDTTGDIFLISTVDREEQDTYTLIVEAIDMGTTPLTGVVEVIIQIIDINEFAPAFTSANYNGSVFENEPTGTSVLQVFTTDQDFGENSTVLYSIVSGNYSELFNIVPDSGVIEVAGDIDYEFVQEVSLIVMATDTGPIETRLSSQVNVTIYIKDRNDNAPQLEERYTVFISEDSLLRDLVLVVMAIDEDSGVNALLNYSIDPLGDTEVETTFVIDSSNGSIDLSGALDRETISSYFFLVNVSDGGVPTLQDSSPVTVHVIDVNDNVPQFTAAFFEGSLPENLQNNTPIVTVEATDVDSGANADIRFSIVSQVWNQSECIEVCGSQLFCNSVLPSNISSDIPFSIDSRTGLVLSNRSLDREERANYVLIVQARDSPLNQTQLSSTTCVTIDVLDRNDEVPMFSLETYQVGISESSPMGESVIQVAVEDRDVGNNSKITFELRTETGSFTIDPTTGVIRTLIGGFDREMRDEYRLMVVARDRGTPSLSSSAIVVVTILDENDSPPEFSQTVYSATVFENLPSGSFVFQAAAFDADIGNNAELSYSIVSISPSVGHFVIDSISGNLTTTQPLDRENIESYSIAVMARDNGTVSLSDTTIINIMVLDENDLPPFFINLPFTATINENMVSLLQPLLIVTATDNDLGTNANIYFTLESVTPPTNAFEVNRTSGEIFVASELDAEYALNYTITVNASNGQALPYQSSKVAIDIQVTDLNDEAPYFEQSDYVTPLLEATPIGGDAIALRAFDDDATIANSELSFDISGGQNRSLFGVNVTTGLVYVAGILDRETEAIHVLEITVSDNGSPKLNATATLTIILQDFNDNPPIFDQTSYSFRINENVPLSTLIGSVRATDLDIQNISYSLTNTSFFVINSTSGEIFSSFVLDREEQEVYSFVAVATDEGGVLQRSTEVIVNVTLLDLNDVAPLFQESPYTISLLENTTVGTVLLTVEAVDADLNENSVLQYTLLPGNDSSFFSINATNGEVLLDAGLDRERQDKFVIYITATDQGVPSLMGMATVQISILDNNDNVPVLNSTKYIMSLPEDAAVGTLILVIGATDRDIDENANITFTISDNFNGIFSIGEQSGILLLTGALDYELVRSYSFFVIATDGGQEPLSNTSQVYVEVLDLNDNPPLFDAELYRISIPENSILSTSVFQIPATDADATTNSELRYTILSGNLGGVFAVNEIFGLITTSDYLDREVTPSYTLGVRVVDLGTPQFTATAVVEVTVQDVNDNPPRFEYRTYSISIPESIEIGSEILSVSASDLDIDLNANLTYLIVEGSTNNAFDLDLFSGIITPTQALDFEAIPSYTLTLMVSDNGLPSPLTDTAIVLISLSDINEAPPTFTSPSYSVDVAQNAVVGTPIGYFIANDNDSNSLIEYRLSGGDGYFNVDELEGTVYVSNPLDNNGSGILTLEAINGDYVTNVTIHVTVVPLSDAITVPLFSQPAFLFEVAESVDIGSIVGFVSDNSFEIVGGSELFNVNENGSIILIGRLDYEATPIYVFNIETSVAPSIFAIVTVRVLDENDNAPVFESAVYTIVVSELVELETTLLVLRAFDRDSNGVNSQLEISLLEIGNERENFAIDPITDDLVVVNLLDYEEQRLHNLTVIATNHLATPTLSSTAQIIVQVTDSNDNDPIFSENFYRVQILASTPVGTEILILEAEDADSGSNAELVFSITHLSTPLSFVVNTTSGTLVTNTTFNLTQGVTSSYVISGLVSDRGNPQPRSDTTTIFIDVTADNMFPPLFSQPTGYYVEIPETVSSGYRVADISAVDPDDPSAMIQFCIESGDTREMFAIDPSTGLIELSTSLDFLEQSFHSLTVSATDFGSPPRKSCAGVNISVIDINNHNPQFTESSYTVVVIENVTIGSFLIQTEATDPDTVNITYQITVNVQNNGIPLFRINSTTGEVFTAAIIDREFADVIEILVSAIDSGYAVQRSQSIPVRIIVQDLNDNPPVFRQSNYSFPVVRLLGQDQTVGMTIATDADIVGEEIMYSIDSDTSGGLFSIDRNTSRITTAAVTPETAALPGYQLVVTAFDGIYSTNVTVLLKIVDDGQFCNSDGFCTVVREVNCTFDIFPHIECNPFCLGQYALSPQRRVCLSHYCLDTGLVPCVAMETCLPTNRACAGVCPEDMSVCPTTDICHVISLTESCDQTNETCLTGQALIQRSDNSRYCEIASNLTQNCTSEGVVFCEALNECHVLTEPDLCQACPGDLVLCADTSECVNDSVRCCGTDGYYCDILDRCLEASARCELPNIAPVANYPLIYLETVEDFSLDRTNDGFVVSLLLGNFTQPAVDAQGELLSVAIVQTSSVQDSYGEWQYALCGDLPSDITGVCSNMSTSWTPIDAGVLSESNALVLPSNAIVRFVRRAIELDGAIWLRVKLWDGNVDEFISPTSDLVRLHTPSYESTLPYTPTSAYSENTTLLVIVILPLITRPVFNTQASLQLSSIQEDVIFADNLGNQLFDIVLSVDIPNFKQLAEDRIEGFEDIVSQDFSEELLPSSVREAYYEQVTLVNPTRRERIESLQRGQNPGVAISLPSEAAGVWQVSSTGDVKTFVNLRSVLTNADSGDILLLGTMARLRFLPAVEFCGPEHILARPWDGYWNQSFPLENGFLVVAAPDVNSSTPALSTTNLNEWERVEVNVICMQDKPVLLDDRVLLDPIPYHLAYRYERIFTLVVDREVSDMRTERNRLSDFLLLTLEVAVDIKKISPLVENRASVSFSVEGDVQPFNEVTALVQNVNATLSLLGFPVLDILQDVSYGPGVGCHGDQPQHYHGVHVNTFFSRFTYDGDSNFVGVAVVAMDTDTQGVWQYHRGNWNSSENNYDPLSNVWIDFPSPNQLELSDTRALLLRSNDRLRYISYPGVFWDNMTAPSISVRIWDGSVEGIAPSGEILTYNINTNPTVDTIQSLLYPQGRFSDNVLVVEAARFGCDGQINSGLVHDACCVCGGGGDSCDGCDGVTGSNAVYDACDECGTTTVSTESTCLGCDYIPFSETVSGECTECVSVISIPTDTPRDGFLFLDPVFVDCNGDCYGDAVMDSCDVCSGGNTQHQPNSDIDCAGVCFGEAVIDDCGDCTGPGSTFQFNRNMDCTGVCNGPFITDSCGVCQLTNENGVIVENRDCAGVCYGTATMDSCDLCVGGGTNLTAGYSMDECGVCGGDDSSCVGCDGGVASGQTIDSCRECGGNNCGCFQLDTVTPNRGPRSGGTEVIVRGAGLFLNDTELLQFEFDRNSSNCGAPYTFPNVVGRFVRITCHFQSPDLEQQQPVFAIPIDQSTVRCITGPTIQNQIYIREFSVQVQIENGPFSNPIPFFYDDYSDVTIDSIAPPHIETNIEGVVSFIGSNFLNTTFQECFFYNFEQCLNSQSSQNPLSIPATFISESEISCQLPPADIPCQVTLRLSLDGQESGIIDTSATIFTYRYSAPIVNSVHFSTDLSTLLIEFDRQVELAPIFSLRCSEILTLDTLSLVGGRNADCNWADSSQRQLVISLPRSASITVNSPTSFAENILLSRGQLYSFAVESTPSLVDQVRNVVRPQAVLNGPLSIPACGPVTFSGINSQFPGYGGLEYYWAIRVQDSTLTNYSDIVTSIESFGIRSPAITLDSDLFLPQTEYYLQLYVINSIGLESETESVLLLKDNEPSSFVYIDANKILRAGEDLIVQSIVTTPQCSNEPQAFDYVWTLIKIIDKRRGITSEVDLSSLKTSSPMIIIPETYLEQNTNYTLSVRVIIGDSSVSVREDVGVSILRQFLQARVESGDRMVSQSRDIVLNGRNSIQDPSVGFSWSCQVVGSLDACYNRSQTGLIPIPISLPRTEFISFPASHLEANRIYTFTLVLEREEDSSQASVTIEVVANRPPIVEISLPRSVVSSQTIVMEGFVFSSVPVETVSWESLDIIGQGMIDVTDQAIVQSQVTYETPPTTETTSLSDYSSIPLPTSIALNVTSRANLILSPNTLTPDLSYTFRLTALTNEGAVYSQVTIVPSSPPKLTQLQATPTSGVALETEFTLEAINSVASPDGSPFQFAFGIIEDDNIDTSVTSVPDHVISWISGIQVSSKLSTFLPASNNKLLLLVRVFDRNGGSSDALTEVTVNPNSALSDEASFTNIITNLNDVLVSTKDWNRVLSNLVPVTLEMNSRSVVYANTRAAILDLIVSVFNDYLPPSQNNYQLVNTVLSHLTANGGIIDTTQQNRIAPIIKTILQWYDSEIQFEQTTESILTQNDGEPLYLQNTYTKVASNFLADSMADDLLKPLANILSASLNPQLSSDYVLSVDLVSRLLCKAKNAGQQASVIDNGLSQLYVDIAQPNGAFDISGGIVDFQNAINDLFEAQTCSTTNRPCVETCVSGAKFGSDFLNPDSNVLPLDGNSSNSLLSQIEGSDPQSVSIFSDIVSASISIPSQNSYLQVSDLPSPIRILIPMRASVPSDYRPLCLYRNVGSGSGFATNEWRLDSIQPLTIISYSGQDHFVCEFDHLTEFVIGLLPPPVITTQPPITTPPPTTPEPTTPTTTPPPPTTPATTIPPPTVPSPAGAIAAVIIVLLVIAAVIVTLLIVFFVWRKKHSKKVKISPATDETDGDEKVKLTKAGPLTPEESKVPMQIILCADKGERKLIGKMNVLPSIRLRELRYQLADNFEMFKQKPFYFLTRQLCDIEPAAEQQQFVSLVFGDKPIFVREVSTENELTKRHFCVCGNAAQFECSNCSSQGYCSPECQLENWADQHQRQCGRLSEKKRRSDVLTGIGGPSEIQRPLRRITLATSPSTEGMATSPVSPTDWKGFMSLGKSFNSPASPQAPGSLDTPKPSNSETAKPFLSRQSTPRAPPTLGPLKKVSVSSRNLPPLSRSSSLQGYSQIASRPSYQTSTSVTRPNFYSTSAGSGGPPPSLRTPVRAQPDLFTRANPQQASLRPPPPARRISITSVGSEELGYSMSMSHDVRHEPLLESDEDDYESSSDGSNISPLPQILNPPTSSHTPQIQSSIPPLETQPSSHETNAHVGDTQPSQTTPASTPTEPKALKESSEVSAHDTSMSKATKEIAALSE